MALEGEGSDYSVLWNSNQLVFSITTRSSSASSCRASSCALSTARSGASPHRSDPPGRMGKPGEDRRPARGDSQRTDARRMRGQLILYDSVALSGLLAHRGHGCRLPVEPREKFRPATEEEELIFGGSEHCRHRVDRLVQAAWDSWPVERRHAELDRIFSSPFGGWGGTPLRTIRSTLVEEFLRKGPTATAAQSTPEGDRVH